MKTIVYILCVLVIGAVFLSPPPENDDLIPESVTFHVDSVPKTIDSVLDSAEIVPEAFDEMTEKNLQYLKYRAKDLDSVIFQYKQQ